VNGGQYVNRFWAYGGAAGVLIVIAACGKTSTSTVTGPTPAKCGVTVATSVDSVAAAGAMQSFAITAPPECTWNAAAEVSWITELSPSTGQGSGNVRFRVMPNSDGRSRQGTITVNNQQVQVRQDASPCRIQLNATNDRFDAKGGTATVSVAVPDGCTWSASTNDRWIVVNGAASGTGAGSVRFDVMPNEGAERNGAISIGGEAVAVRQNGVARNCTASIDPSSMAMPAAGGSGTFDVTVSAGCTWTAASSVQWITLVDGASGSGNAAVRFRAASNPGAARTGRIGVAGNTFVVNQAGQAGATCSYAINPTNASIASTAGSGTVAVSAAAGCSWSATSNAGWITITSGATGAGNGTVGFRVDTFSGSTRTGTLAIAGLTFTVTQTQTSTDTRCSYAISPTNRDASPVGGTFTVSVSTSSTCRWTVKSDEKWMNVTPDAGGTGTGSVSLVVAPNTTKSARTGTATIAGQTFTVRQSAPSGSALP
jgi:Viral BACON domain/Putative binding domain, N-terminal